MSRLKFEVGETYVHSTGKEIYIAGAMVSRQYGLCLIGETDKGQFVPIGNDKDSPVNWQNKLQFGEAK